MTASEVSKHIAVDWSKARQLIPQPPGIINLNAGTLSPTPLPLLEAVNQLRLRQAGNPSDFVWRHGPPMLQAARETLARYLNCSAADLLLLPNITFAMNIAVASLALQLPSGAEILTTDHEYGAMMNCWQRAADERGWNIRRIKLPDLATDPAEIVEAFTREIADSTAVLYFSHVNCTTGLVMPVTELAKLARERNLICVIDGAHAPGMVPVDLQAIDADYYAANCHKWMMAPSSAGFLHVAPHRRAMTRPLITSWGWGYPPEKIDQPCVFGGGSNWQMDLEFHGTVDRTPQMVLPQVLQFRREQLDGEESIRARCRSLVEHARAALSDRALTPATPADPRLSGMLLAFHVPGCDPVKARDWLWNTHHIECPVTLGGGKHFLRVSCAWFNTEQEIDKLAAVIPEFVTGIPH
jgi:isopenicillin-N epimerase